jgi:hypothetical protein
MASPTARPTARPAARRARRHVRLRLALQYAFLSSTFLVILHYNVVRPYLLRGADPDVAVAEVPAWLRAPAAAYDSLLEGGKRVGMSLIWRMYSPVPRHLRQTEWQALDARGRWVPVSAPGVATPRRRDRSLADALLWDFKRARINDNYFVRRYRDDLPWLYVLASRDHIVRELGFVPEALRVSVRTAPIPAPAHKGDWRPEDAVFDAIKWQEVYR